MSDLLRAYERGVLRVTINRPDKRNALSRGLLRELKTVFDAHASLEDLRLAVVTGAEDVAFSAGGDLVDLAQVRDAASADAFSAEATAALDAVRLFPAPTVAAVNGLALGGGAELALACDMRIAAAHARIGFVHANLNISTAWGGGADLMRLAGYARALELLATGVTLSAAEAKSMGLVNQVASGEFIAFIERFIAPMKDRTPAVMRALKAQAIGERFNHPVAERRSGDQERFVATWLSPEHWEVADSLLTVREER